MVSRPTARTGICLQGADSAMSALKAGARQGSRGGCGWLSTWQWSLKPSYWSEYGRQKRILAQYYDIDWVFIYTYCCFVYDMYCY